MAEEFGAQTGALRATSGDLEEVSSRMRGVLSSLRGQLAAEGAPWGDDEIGDQFAEGPGGYLAQQDWVDGSVHAKTELLDYYADGLRRAADGFERADEG